MSSGTKTTNAPWGPQQRHLKDIFDRSQGLWSQGPARHYGDFGQTVAGPSGPQQQAWSNTMRYGMGPRSGAQQAAAEKALIGGLSGGVNTEVFNPLISNMANQVTSNLQSNIMPKLRQSAMMSGHQGGPGASSRQFGEMQKGISNAVNTSLVNRAADMYGDAYSGAQDRAVQYGQMYPSIMSAPLQMYGAMGNVGQQMQDQQQRGIDADMQRWNYYANAPQQHLQNFANMVRGNYGGTSKQGGNTMGQIAQIAGMFMMSDTRTKENVVPEGTNWRGHNVYHFNYIGDDVRRRGVMAQEVERARPDAVAEVDGIKYVNYEAL